VRTNACHWLVSFFVAVFLLNTLWVGKALADGGSITGPSDLASHWGTPIFLLSIVIVGAGVLVWVLQWTPPEEEEDEPRDGPPAA
jgi:hypothetical protein